MSSVVEVQVAPTSVEIEEAETVTVEVGIGGPQGQTGATGPSGVVAVTAPITNTGSASSAVIGIDQAALAIAPAQVTGTAVVTTDARLSDTRTPTSHASTHGSAGSDAITIAPSQVTGTAVITTDSRLSDSRTPTDSTVSTAKIVDAAVTAAKLADSSVSTAKVDSAGLAQSALAGVGISAWAASTSYSRGDLVHYLGVTYRRTAAGTSGSTFNSSNWHQVTPDLLDAVSKSLGYDGTGIDVPSREGPLNSYSITSGTVGLAMFTPMRDTTVSAITMATGNTQAATVTLIRMGIYEMTGANAGTLRARTASDTTLFNGTQTAFQRSLDTTGGYPASYTLTAGTRYAVAVIQVATTPATLIGANVAAQTQAVLALASRITGAIGSQTDLPTSFTSLSAFTTRPFARLS